MGGRSLEKGTRTDYDVIMKSEFKFKGNGGFRDCGPGTEIIFGASEEYSFQVIPG